MDPALNKRYSALAAEGLQNISQEFADEIKRRPSIVELLEILTWALRSCGDDAFLDVHPANIIALKPEVKKGIRPISSRTQDDAAESVVGDLNDNVFVIANDFISNLITMIRSDTGQTLTLDDLCELLVRGLHLCDADLLADVNPMDIIGIKAKVYKTRKIVPRVGDVVAIPAKNGEYFLAVILAKNRFGIAYGFFEGTSKLKPISMASHPPVKRHSVYSGDELIANGRWKIISHNKELLSLFPSEPEIYHTGQNIVSGIEIGPYGSGETASGQLRPLMKEEAEELGLFSGQYRQIYTPAYLEIYLNSKLKE